MHRTLKSLYYPASYLLGTGTMMLLAPRLMLRLSFSTGDYGDVMPRMVGCTLVALGILVVQVIRHRLHALYPTLVGVRVFLCAGWVGLYLYSRDPFFLVVFGVVATGLVWTSLALLADRRAARVTA